ncbi:OsmC family protein [Streptomyces sp. N35]|uniref:OsmC family protein n=1 Tax=Streptomyces sp. N35 TaxID=2795730 RepID=UPI0018F7B2AE|nr:OsmC family protein [Streptomyces sp. N35]
MNQKNDTRAVQPSRSAFAPSGEVGAIAVTYVAGQSYAVRVRGHELTVDQPPESGGADGGPTPVELFVASLAACVAYYAGRFLQRHHLPYDQLRVRAHFEMAEDRPARVAAIRMQVQTPGVLDATRREGLRAVASHCTVHNSLREPPAVSVELK